jgi:hypothetical protein
MAATFLDLTNEAPNPPPQKTGADGKRVNTCQIKNGKALVRDPKTIKGIGIHQTACVFGPMNDINKRHRRALGVPIHALAFRDGVIATPYPMLWYMYHGNGLNAFTYGLEIEGHYPGLLDDPTTPRREDEESVWGSSATPLDDLTIETARTAVKYLYEKGLSLGSPLQYIWAHRQSSGTRRSDPGAAIWKHVVLDYAVAVLKLKTEPKRTWQAGMPIPSAWEPGTSGKY